jgi:hypothetical protein
MKQSAVEWLANELVKKGFPIGKYGMDLFEQAKEIEKKIIKKAWVDGNYNTDSNGTPSKNYAISDDRYYQKNF